MFLYVNGCSFTYGYELADDSLTRECIDNEYRLKYSWSGRLQNMLHFEDFFNDSKPGGSNDRILRTTFDWVLTNWLNRGKDSKDLFVIIGWSEVMRREFYINGAWRQIIPYHDYDDLPSVNIFNKIYKKLAWNEYESAVRFATQVISIQSFFNYYGIRYLFFDALRSIRKVAKDANGKIDTHVSQIDAKRYLGCNKENGDMRTVLQDKKTNWKGRHPSEEGHDYWAKYLANYIHQQGILND